MSKFKMKLPKLKPVVWIGGGAALFVIVFLVTRKPSSSSGGTEYVSTGPSEAFQLQAAQIAAQGQAQQYQYAALQSQNATDIALAQLNVQGSLDLAGVQANDNVNTLTAQLEGMRIESQTTRELAALEAGVRTAETMAFRDTALAATTANYNMFALQTEAGIIGDQLTAQVYSNQAQYQRDIEMARIDADRAVELDRGVTDRASISGANKRNKSNNTAGIIGNVIGGALALFSDPRLKYDIEQIGETKDGIPLYSYGMFGMKTTGVMADEAMMYDDSLVGYHESGFKMVDYSRVYG